MESIRQDVELLRGKALECEKAFCHAKDPDSRHLIRKHARLYWQLIAEAEETLRRQQQTERFRRLQAYHHHAASALRSGFTATYSHELPM